MGTTADKLAHLSETKSLIRTAIQNKGINVPESNTFRDYVSRLNEIIADIGFDWSQDYYNSVFNSTMGSYTRPADWLNIDSLVIAGEQKIVMLVAVNEESNFFAFRVTTSTGQYQVDWGDGNITLHNTATTAERNLIYSNFPGTESTRGYRQGIITITPVSGNLLTYDANFKHSQSNLQNGYTEGYLDIRMAGVNFTTLRFSGSSTTSRSTLLERFEFVGTCNVTTLTSAFQDCNRLQFINLFDTSKVTNMTSMFQSCHSLRTIPLLNTSIVTNMTSMFQSCTNLLTIPLLNTPLVTNTSGMFSSCLSFKVFPLLNMQNVTNTNSMFFSCSSLISIPSTLNTANVLSMFSMFNGCSTITTIVLNTQSATGLSSMFSNCSSLRSVTLSNTQNVTNMGSMFSSCVSLKSVPLFNTQNVTNMNAMFSSCSSLKTIPLFNTQNVTNMNTMFSNCLSLIEVPLLNMQSVTDSGWMFNNCSSLKTIPLFNMANVTNTSYMFQSCPSLIEIPQFNTINVTNAEWMFTGCLSLRTIPLLNFTKVTLAERLFASCRSLESIPALSFAATNTTTVFAFSFSDNPSLSKISISGVRANFSVANCRLSAPALVELFNNLPTSSSRTITISGNWGASLLTTPERQIATNKGWIISG